MKAKIMKILGLTLLTATAATAFPQAPSQPVGVVGTWHLVKIDSPGPDGKPANTGMPRGLLIYTRDRHASVQLMYPEASLSNEFVHDGYEATFGTYELDERRQLLTYHVEASATREKIVGKSEILRYAFPDAMHMIIRPADVNQHWSVIWQRY